MILRISKVLQDNRYMVTLAPENWSAQDLERMDRFGEPEVETGGTGTLLPAFDFPTEPRLIKSGFPYTRFIDGDEDVDAKGKMNNWAVEMETRLNDTLTVLRTQTDDFTGESAVNV